MAGWYDENYKYRAPITLFGVGAGSQDYEIEVPSSWDLFWDNIQSTGYDIRVCDADGVTLLTFDRDSFSYANKTLQIELDNVAEPGYGVAAVPQYAWLYWGYAAAADAATSFAPASAVTGKIPFEQPPTVYTVVCGPQPQGQTKPSSVLTKASGETIFVYWDVTDILAQRQSASEGSQKYEFVGCVTAYAVLLAGADQTTMRTAASAAGATNKIRVLEVGGRIYIRTDVIGGTDGTEYTLSLTFTAVMNVVSSTIYDKRTLNVRALLNVRDVSEV